MYHSHLLINVGDNPDRPDWNICRRWLRNLYRVHQRLCMAFPADSPAEHERESAYCRPYDHANFPHQLDLPTESANSDVHHPRTTGNGFLFRIDYPVDMKQRAVDRSLLCSRLPPSRPTGITRSAVQSALSITESGRSETRVFCWPLHRRLSVSQLISTAMPWS